MTKKISPSEPQEVVVDYAGMDAADQFHFRQGMHASWHLNVSDATMHEHLMNRGLIRITSFRNFMLQSFSPAFTLGYCYGAELGIGQKRNIQSLERSNV